ncbi:thiolase C-terminal domain-containing protein [Celeribacter litoreus]|uniref:thiolase C-terminal domain-containing protein n=1 Tax=Celeribacter litoreus TaxID=2876714 RepID=UPI001CCFB562|nr:thiolase family protein [Celeribacter litoreus]MCA0043374.1 thiolase family protein [Celeribacter litoreus]
MSLRNRAVIVGVGESDIGKMPHMSGLGLNAQAARRAIADAGIKHTDIDGVLTAYSFTEPYFMLGSVLAEYLGITPRFGGSLVVGGASPAAMLHHAAQAIETGQAEVVLVCAGENRATGLSRDAAVSALSAVGHPYFEAPYGVGIPSLYAIVANAYMHKYGTTREQMAAVSVNTRNHALKHPNAHMKTAITVDDVLSSKPISDPLNMLDCCLISDAGGAFIVTSPERAKDMPGKEIYLAGIGELHTHEHLTSAPSLTEFGAGETARAAYSMAGLGPEDMDLAMLYDCFSIVPIIEMEELGLAPRGEGGAYFAEGLAAVGGKIPVNTHGGMLSHAHAGAVGGLMAIIEAVRQLRGEADARQVKDANAAVIHGEGGILSSHLTMVLTSEAR